MLYQLQQLALDKLLRIFLSFWGTISSHGIPIPALIRIEFLLSLN